MKHSLRTGLAFLAMVPLLAMPAAIAPASAAVTGDSDSSQDSLITYQVDLSALPGAQQHIEKGVASGETCSFKDSGEGVATGTPTLQVSSELSYDPRTCTRKVAQATYTQETAPSWARALFIGKSAMAQQAQAFSDASTKSIVGDPTASADTAAATATYSGAYYAGLMDPVGLLVTETDALLTWTASSTSVTSYSSSGRWAWLNASGWSKTGGAKTAGRTSSTEVWVNTTGTFKNPTFCPVVTGGPTTYANHVKTWFAGRAAGGYSWAHDIRKSGGCTNLLSVRAYIIRP